MNNKNVELKETITFDEYKAWLMGLVRGKGNQLPDLNDWKAIKKMTDKVVPDVVEEASIVDWTVTWEDLPSLPEKDPEPINWFVPTYGSSGAQDGDNITINTTGSFQTNGVAIGDKVTVSESYDGVTPEGGFVITGSLSGGHYGGYGGYGCPVAPLKSSIEDYAFDTSKYTIISAGFDTIKKKEEE